MTASGARVEVTGADRPRLRLTSGLLRAQQVHGTAGRPRVVLIAATALLLGGDRVELDVRLGPGARLDLAEVAGTVAYPGPPSTWHVSLELGPGAELTFRGQPLVIAAGADVDRALTASLAEDARLWLRETVVLGRHDETGGTGVSRTRVAVGGTPVLIEDQSYDLGLRTLPGVLGRHRVLDTLLRLGPDAGGDGAAPAGVPMLRVAGGHGWLARWLGPELATSPLNRSTDRSGADSAAGGPAD